MLICTAVVSTASIQPPVQLLFLFFFVLYIFLQRGHLVKFYPSRSENPLHLGNSNNQMWYLLIPAGQENYWAALGGQTSGSTALRPGGIRCVAQGLSSRTGAGFTSLSSSDRERLKQLITNYSRFFNAVFWRHVTRRQRKTCWKHAVAALNGSLIAVRKRFRQIVLTTVYCIVLISWNITWQQKYH